MAVRGNLSRKKNHCIIQVWGVENVRFSHIAELMELK
jgi:hypothetical protein